jgi:hypothetical protein
MIQCLETTATSSNRALGNLAPVPVVDGDPAPIGGMPWGKPSILCAAHEWSK